MSLTVSSLSKSYYNIYALTNSDTYKAHAVDSSAVSKAKFNVADISTAFDTLTSESNFSTIGSISGYAKDLYKLSQIKQTGTSGSLTNNVVSLMAGDTDMFSILDTSAAHAQKVKEALSGTPSTGDTKTKNAISAYSGFVSAYTQFIKNDNDSLISVLL